MTWRTLLFAHWPVAPVAVQPLLPRDLLIDTFEGAAWVGLIPFTMRDVGLTWWPPVPSMHHFHECNVRTYVHLDGEPGVWFFSLDAASRLGVWAARRWWRLNYRYARMDLRHEGDVVRYSVDRVGSEARLRCAWRIGDPRHAARPGDLDHFLTERYMLYTVDRNGHPRRGRIWHRPWSLRDAELLELEDGLVRAAGIAMPQTDPVVWAADPLKVAAWWPEARRNPN